MRHGDGRVVLGTVVGLGVADVARTAWLPDGAHLAFNLALSVAVVAIGVASGLSTTEWGLELSTVRAGLRWGGSAMLLVLTATALAAAVAGSSALFDDDRADVGFGTLLLRVLVVIPLGTVIMEELAFRGLLLGMTRRIASTPTAVVTTSLLFGLWHVPGRWGEPIVDLVAVVAATGVAGLAFGWLRVRSGSLVAPILAHLAINTVPLTAAWLVAQLD